MARIRPVGRGPLGVRGFRKSFDFDEFDEEMAEGLEDPFAGAVDRMFEGGVATASDHERAGVWNLEDEPDYEELGGVPGQRLTESQWVDANRLANRGEQQRLEQALEASPNRPAMNPWGPRLPERSGYLRTVNDDPWDQAVAVAERMISEMARAYQYRQGTHTVGWGPNPGEVDTLPNAEAGTAFADPQAVDLMHERILEVLTEQFPDGVVVSDETAFPLQETPDIYRTDLREIVTDSMESVAWNYGYEFNTGSGEFDRRMRDDGSEFQPTDRRESGWATELRSESRGLSDADRRGIEQPGGFMPSPPMSGTMPGAPLQPPRLPDVGGFQASPPMSGLLPGAPIRGPQGPTIMSMEGEGSQSAPPWALTPEQRAAGKEWLPEVRKTLEGTRPVADNLNPQSQMSQTMLADMFAQQAAQQQKQSEQGYFGGLGEAVGNMSTEQKIALALGLSLLTGGGASPMIGPALGIGAGLAAAR